MTKQQMIERLRDDPVAYLRFIDLAEASELAGAHSNTLRRWWKAGRIPEPTYQYNKPGWCFGEFVEALEAMRTREYEGPKPPGNKVQKASAARAEAEKNTGQGTAA